MATPTKTELCKLDYSYLGQPFCRVAAQTGLSTTTLDYSFLGMPFVGAYDAATPSTSSSETMTSGAISLVHARQELARRRRR